MGSSSEVKPRPLLTGATVQGEHRYQYPALVCRIFTLKQISLLQSFQCGIGRLVRLDTGRELPLSNQGGMNRP